MTNTMGLQHHRNDAFDYDRVIQPNRYVQIEDGGMFGSFLIRGQDECSEDHCGEVSDTIRGRLLVGFVVSAYSTCTSLHLHSRYCQQYGSLASVRPDLTHIL